MVEIA